MTRQCSCERLGVQREEGARCTGCPKRDEPQPAASGYFTVGGELRDKLSAIVMANAIDPRPTIELRELLKLSNYGELPEKWVSTLSDYAKAREDFRETQYKCLKLLGLIATTE